MDRSDPVLNLPKKTDQGFQIGDLHVGDDEEIKIFPALGQGSQVIGYYSLAVGAVDHGDATARVRKGLARHPIPVMVLARLAVDLHYQGKKIGRCLLRDAILRTLQAADIAGIRVIFVNAKDERARGFYERFGFEPSPIHSLQLMLLIKDCQKTIGGVSASIH